MNCTFDSKFSDLTVLKGDKGDKGDKGEKGDKGDKGAPGKDGASATVYAGTTTTGEPGTQASVVNTGTAQAAVFNFTIPRGDKGEPGHDGTDGDDGYTPQRGVDYWTAADVQTIENYVNEQIVAQGYTLTPATSTTLGGIKVGENLTISSDGTLGAPYAEKGDKGDKGDKGERGEQGAKGDTGADGKSAYQYAQEGGYTGTEADFAAKLAEEMPDTLPNPNALTFTGAVTGTYDGSEPVSVEIPSGNSGNAGANHVLALEVLASGTVAAGSTDPVNTGVKLSDLKQYKLFLLSISGVANISLANWYTRLNEVSISRVNNFRALTILYEFLNENKTLMIAKSATNGNSSVVKGIGDYIGHSYSYGAVGTGAFASSIYNLSRISDDTPVITYPTGASIDVEWAIWGVTK